MGAGEVLAQAAAYRIAVHERHAHVKHDEVGILLGALERGRAVAGGEHLVAQTREILVKQRNDFRLVVHDEDGGVRCALGFSHGAPFGVLHAAPEVYHENVKKRSTRAPRFTRWCLPSR